MTTIKCNEDLYNYGKCFTEGKEYEVDRDVKTAAGLMEVAIVNDLGERHIIGSWWRNFEILN